MQELGVIHKMDDLGRVVIPAHIRKELQWKAGTPLEFFAERGGVFLREYNKSCVFCGKREGVQLFENKLICKDCISRLQK